MAENLWKAHTIMQLNGHERKINLDARFQIMSETWNRITVGPNLIYMPDKDRLLMSVNMDHGVNFHPVHYAMVTISDDRGMNWSNPEPVKRDKDGNPDSNINGIGAATYLGQGRVLVSSEGMLFFSYDYGDTWSNWVNTPDKFYAYFTMMTDVNPETGDVIRLLNPSYLSSELDYHQGGLSSGALWFSDDAGKTWGDPLVIPEWYGFDEPFVVRAKNGDLVAALRSEISADSARDTKRVNFDHYSGLGVSISTDNGYSWSKVNMLFDFGRHHATIVLMPDGELVMTYVVRMGYPTTEDGFPQWGIEAIVSKDNGRSWDFDHRYILASWIGKWKGPNSWYHSCQHAASVLLPDNCILTAFGTGYRAELDSSRKELPYGLPTPRDVGLVMWKMNSNDVNGDDSITKAAFDSDLRNKIDIRGTSGSWDRAVYLGKKNITAKNGQAFVSTSESDDDVNHILYNPYCRYCFKLDTIPAWIEISWPDEHVIDEIHIHPGAPEMARTMPDNECTPLDYMLQFMNKGVWIDLIEPVESAPRYNEYKDFQNNGAYHHQKVEFKYVHKFQPTKVEKIRLYISRTSDSGSRAGSKGVVVVPEGKRKTYIRGINVFESNINQ